MVDLDLGPRSSLNASRPRGGAYSEGAALVAGCGAAAGLCSRFKKRAGSTPASAISVAMKKQSSKL